MSLRQTLGTYGIVANVLEPDRVFRMGARAWLAWGTGGDPTNVQWIACSRSGRPVMKWAPIHRFNNFRPHWIPDHLDDDILGTPWNARGAKEAMLKVARELEAAAEEERQKHPNRRIKVKP